MYIKAISPVFSICPKHGYIAGEHDHCPKCDKELGYHGTEFDLTIRQKHTSDKKEKMQKISEKTPQNNFFIPINLQNGSKILQQRLNIFKEFVVRFILEKYVYLRPASHYNIGKKSEFIAENISTKIRQLILNS